MKCLDEHCERPARARGTCLMHYKRRIRHEGAVARGQANFSLPEWAGAADLGYAAGYIDADGSITLATTKSKSTLHGVAFYPHISAVSIDTDSVIFLLNLFGGGKITTRERTGGNLSSRFPIHQWYVGGRRACWICSLLAPHLKIKAVQADAVSKFYDSSWKQGPATNSMPEAEFQRRLALVGSVKSRNQRDYLQKIKLEIA